MKQIFQKTNNLKLRDQKLQDVNVTFTNIQLDLVNEWDEIDYKYKKQQTSRDQSQCNLELFFDEGQMIIELKDLKFLGQGNIRDPNTRKTEKIKINAPIATAHIVLLLAEELKEWNSVYPRLTVHEVLFQIEESNIIVSAFGEVPMFKTHGFENSVKKWFLQQLEQRQDEIKQIIQQMEQNAFSQINYSQKFFSGVLLNSSLSEQMKMVDDYILVSFMNEFDTIDHEFDKPLREIKATFNEENDFKKDLQIIIDENYLNHQLLGLFHVKDMISLTEVFINWMPESISNLYVLVNGFFTTTVFSHLFPDILNYYDLQQRVDIRCAFSKELLQPMLGDVSISQVLLRKQDIASININFGCGLYVHNKSEDNLYDLFQPVQQNSPFWQNWKSFYTSFDGEIEFDFNKDWRPQQSQKYIIFNIKNVSLNFKQFKIYENDTFQLLQDDSDSYQKFYQQLRALFLNSTYSELTSKKSFPTGFPISPFPTMLNCLGLSIIDTKIQGEEGFVRLAYNFYVKEIDESCFFNVFQKSETLIDKVQEFLTNQINKIDYQKYMDKMDELQKKGKEWLQGIMQW